MTEAFITWLHGLDAVPLALLFCSALVAVTLLGILLIHPRMRKLIHGGRSVNDVVVCVAGSFGLIYAVLMGLLTVAAFERTKLVYDDVGREAANLAAIYRSAEDYPQPLRDTLKMELRDYTRYVIDKDWPAHRLGIVPVGGEHRLAVIRRQLLQFEPTKKSQEVLHTEMLRYLNDIYLAREQRVNIISTAIPSILCYIVLLGAFINISFLWMLNMSIVPQILFGCVTSVFLGAMIFLVYALDHPLQPAMGMRPEAFESIYQVVMRWDDPG